MPDLREEGRALANQIPVSTRLSRMCHGNLRDGLGRVDASLVLYIWGNRGTEKSPEIESGLELMSSGSKLNSLSIENVPATSLSRLPAFPSNEFFVPTSPSS
jgi:hypothetical protein